MALLYPFWDLGKAKLNRYLPILKALEPVHRFNGKI
jgi:hypothetical protein